MDPAPGDIAGDGNGVVDGEGFANACNVRFNVRDGGLGREGEHDVVGRVPGGADDAQAVGRRGEGQALVDAPGDDERRLSVCWRLALEADDVAWGLGPRDCFARARQARALCVTLVWISVSAPFALNRTIQ